MEHQLPSQLMIDYNSSVAGKEQMDGNLPNMKAPSPSKISIKSKTAADMDYSDSVWKGEGWCH